MATEEKATKLVKTPPPAVAPIKDEITQLIQQALTTNVSIETMKELLVMRKELKAEKAKEAFDAAMSTFQAECPVIEKKKKVNDKNGKHRYSFAPIEDIIEQVKPILGKNGLSYAFKTIQNEKEFGIICIAKHELGHSEETSFTVPVGTEDYMTNVQKFGARNTFCKRYAFTNAFGISTGDEDTDAGEKDRPETTGIDDADVDAMEEATTHQELLNICKNLKVKYPNKMKTLISLYNFRKTEIEANQAQAEEAKKEGEAKSAE